MEGVYHTFIKHATYKLVTLQQWNYVNCIQEWLHPHIFHNELSDGMLKMKVKVAQCRSVAHHMHCYPLTSSLWWIMLINS